MRLGRCCASGRCSLCAPVVGLAHHLDRSTGTLGEQHRAFGYVAIELRGGLHEPVSADRVSAVERLPEHSSLLQHQGGGSMRLSGIIWSFAEVVGSVERLLHSIGEERKWASALTIWPMTPPPR